MALAAVRELRLRLLGLFLLRVGARRHGRHTMNHAAGWERMLPASNPVPPRDATMESRPRRQISELWENHHCFPSTDIVTLLGALEARGGHSKNW